MTGGNDVHLIGSLASPFVQRVLITVRAKGHDLAVRPPHGGSLTSPEFQNLSPMGRIPLLQLDDGQLLCESAAIAAYLDETLPGPSLLPGDALARARAREIAALAVLEIGAGMRPLMVHLVFRRGEKPDLIASARAQVEKGAEAIERLLHTDGPYAIGARLTAADAALAPLLALIDVAGDLTGMRPLVAARPKLAAYWRRAAADPVLGRSVVEMQEGFAAIGVGPPPRLEPLPPPA